MNSRIKLRLFKTFPALFIAFAFSAVLRGQVLKDTATFRLMCRGVDLVYNSQFEEAEAIYKKVAAVYPGHPIVYVYKGLITYWKNYPIIPSSSARESFENDMLQAIAIAEKKPDHKSDPEYLLANIGARGLLLLFYAENDLTTSVIPMASSTYQYVKASFNHTKSYADFFFVTGLYNYYREAYPETHPIYKPVALLFPKGDRAKGLRELQIAATNSIVLKAEAYSFLTGIYISFENNYQQAHQFSKSLHELYPGNDQFLAVYVKNLLLVKRYDEAEKLIRIGRERSSNRYFLALLSILDGILHEKKHNNPKQAQYHYEKGIREIEPYGTFGKEFAAYGYYGLSRLSDDKSLKKAYRKKAVNLSAFKNVNFD